MPLQLATARPQRSTSSAARYTGYTRAEQEWMVWRIMTMSTWITTLPLWESCHKSESESLQKLSEPGMTPLSSPRSVFCSSCCILYACRVSCHYDWNPAKFLFFETGFSGFQTSNALLRESVHTHGNEGLVEAVEAQVPDESAVGERRNKPEVEVGNDQKWSTAHHPGNTSENTNPQIKV